LEELTETAFLMHAVLLKVIQNLPEEVCSDFLPPELD